MVYLSGMISDRLSGKPMKFGIGGRFGLLFNAIPVQIRNVETMKQGNTLKTKGFTIIELMIVLAIAAILLSLAYPSYIDYVRKSKRGDAQQALMNWSVNQEIWRSNHPAYASTTDMPAADLENYSLSTTGTLNGNEFTLQAAAKAGNDQNNDEAKGGASCATLTLNSNGVKAPANCWE